MTFRAGCYRQIPGALSIGEQMVLPRQTTIEGLEAFYLAIHTRLTPIRRYLGEVWHDVCSPQLKAARARLRQNGIWMKR
jgi:hypothetical protein